MITQDSISFDIVNSKRKIQLVFPGIGTIQDMIRFGFSYVDSEDHFVAYILAHPIRMKAILIGFPDAILDPDTESIGNLWTAKLIATKRIKVDQIVFANSDLGVILALNIPNPDTQERLLNVV
jgi:hypothetical protein